jgi:hypothetical protein
MTGKTNIPFNFLFAYLPQSATTSPAFGMHSVYLEDKIVLMLSQRPRTPTLNGVWIATYSKHHDSLIKEIPSAKPLKVNLTNTRSNWLFLPASSADFEQSALIVCELIAKRDQRIGRTRF